MRKFYLPLLLSLFVATFGVRAQNALTQNLPTSQGEVVFVEVKELQEQELDQHMAKLADWFSGNDFVFEKVTEDDRTRDKARGRGSIQVLWGPNNFEQYFKTVKFDIQMVVKKDRYQYRFDHFVVKDGTREVQLEIYQSDTKLGGRYNPECYREIDSKIKGLSDELQSAMTKD